MNLGQNQVGLAVMRAPLAFARQANRTHILIAKDHDRIFRYRRIHADEVFGRHRASHSMNHSRKLPKVTKTYAKTPVFTAITVPDSLKNDHNLKPGTWGLMHIEKGVVQFFLKNDTSPSAELNAGDTFVILPEERHHIRVSEDVAFYIEFYR